MKAITMLSRRITTVGEFDYDLFLMGVAEAVNTFSKLEENVLPGNPSLLVSIAEWQWRQGYLPVAKTCFEKVCCLSYKLFTGFRLVKVIA